MTNKIDPSATSPATPGREASRRKSCRKCLRTLNGWHRRQLCPRCYYQPKAEPVPLECNAIYGRRGVALTASHVLDQPTSALPGTPEKAAVLERRAESGLCLWHPLDARYGERGTACA